MSKWFIQIDNKVSGPFENEKITELESKNPQMLVWGKGLPNWLTYADWNDFLKQNILELETLKKNHSWHFKIDNVISEVYTFENLVKALKALSTLENVQIKKVGDAKWENIYSVGAIVDQLGISRRMQLRVPILGFVEGERIDTHESLKAKVVSISEGGFGVTDAHNFRHGTSMKGVIRSPNLNSDIHFHADVVYIKKDGNTGLKFTSLSLEAKSQIVEYVNRFKESL